MNTPVTSAEFADQKTLVIQLENALEARLVDDCDQYETMQIVVGQNPSVTYIV